MIIAIKKQLYLLYSKIINCDSSLVLGIAVFLIFVSIGLINLSFHHPPLIDDEALGYGNMGVAILDGNISEITPTSFRFMPHEGSQLLLSPLVALFFSFFGENYYTLQAMGVLLTGLWAVVWFFVACQLLKKRKIWLASLFILATPLIHLQKSPVSLIFTHVGVSILFGLSLLFLHKSQNLENNKKRVFLFVSGFIYSICFFYGPISLLLLPTILILFLKPRLRLSGFFYWILGLSIAFVFYFQYYDWHFLENAGQVKLISNQTTLSVFISLLIYFGGILKNEALSITQIGNPGGIYSLLSVFYLAFLLALAAHYLVVRFLKEGTKLLWVKNINIEFLAFFAGSILFLIAVAHLRFKLTLHAFDGLRYLIPLIPFYMLALGYFWIENYNKLFIKVLFLFYFGFTLFVLYSFGYPFQEKSKEVYSQIGGFNAVYLLTNPETATQINLKNATDSRLGRYAFTIGRAYTELPYNLSARKKEIEKQLSTRSATVRQHALDEFIRGYYFQKGLSLTSCQAAQEFFEENKYDLDPLTAQGLGMGIAKRSIDRNDMIINPKNKCFEEIYKFSNEDILRNLGWGYGRHFYHAKGMEIGFLTSDKLKGVSEELYEGVLAGKDWAQKYYHPLDPLYTWIEYINGELY